MPWVEVTGDAGDEAALATATSELERRYGVRLLLGHEIGRVRHAITTRRIAAHVHAAEVAVERATEVAEGRATRWVTREDLPRLPLSSLVTKVLAL